MNVPNDLRARYLERRKNDLRKCSHYLATDDRAALEKIGHQLKGNGVTYGYPELSEIGGALERAARFGAPDDLRRALNQFQLWLAEHFN